MMRLIANRALKRYGTRRLSPGDEFEAKDKHARILVGLKRARLAEPLMPSQIAGLDLSAAGVTMVDATGAKVENPFENRSALNLDEDKALERLRRTAAGLGIEVDGRWGAKRLQSEVDLAIAAGRRAI